VQIEAGDVRVPRRAGQYPRRVRLLPHPPHARARTAAERDAAPVRSTTDAGESRGLFNHRVRPREFGIVAIETPAPEKTPHPRVDRREQDADLFIRRRGRGPEAKRLPFAAVGEEDAIEQQRVKVDVEVEPAPESLDHGYAAGVAGADAVAARPPPLEAQQHAYVDPEHGAGELVIPGQKIAKAVRQAQHPLPDRNAREHIIDEASGVLGHAPAPAARAETASLAGERDEPLERAVGAAETSETVRQHAAREEIPELLLHEHR
jgi:hypothetical protein